MKPVKIGQFEVNDSLEGWEIVNEVGVGRWLGRVVDQDPDKRTLTLQPALEMSSPSQIPVYAEREQKVGVVGGKYAAFVLDEVSDHPIRDLQYSSRQRCSEMSEDTRLCCFTLIVEAIKRPR